MYIAAEQFSASAFSIKTAERDQRRPEADFAWRVLEEIDYGLILVSPAGMLQHVNHLARNELARARFLRIRGNCIAGATPEQTPAVMQGIREAARGRRH